MRILIMMAVTLLFVSCNNRSYFGASNYTLEWQDFTQPITVEDDFEYAVTPKFYYEGGGSTPSGIVKELYGGYVGGSAVVKEKFVFGLGGGYRGGYVQTNPNDNNPNTIERYNTNNWQANAQLGVKAKNTRRDFYPILVGFNYGQDGGDYLGFRQRLRAANTINSIDVEDLFSWQIGSKVTLAQQENGSVTIYGGVLTKDRSTSSAFERGTNSIITSAALNYSNFTFDVRGTLGYYGAVGLGLGYRFE